MSFVIIGRNDDYMGDYLYRLGTTLSFLAQSAEAAGLHDQVEVLVVDWASERPLAVDLPLHAAARRITVFLEVKPDVVHRRFGEARWLPTVAVNVGIRRARGEFILFTDSDCLWPASALSSLGRLVREEVTLPSPIRELFCYVRRYQVPWQTVQRRPRLDDWRRLIPLLLGAVAAENAAAECLGGFSAGQLMHRDLWFAARGYDEALDRPWGWSDNDLMLRVSQAHSWLDVSGYGVFGLHMEHWPRADGRYTRDPSTVNPMLVRNSPVVNHESWGLGDLDIPAGASICDATAPAGSGCDVPLSGQTASLLGAEWQSLDDREVIARIVRTDRPRNLYWFGTIEPPVLETIVDNAPAAEVYLINPWPEGASDGLPLHPGLLAALLARRRFKGWARIVQGDMSSALDRIERSTVGNPPVELAWLGAGASPDVIRDLIVRLAPGGVALCRASADPHELTRLNAIARQCVVQRLGRTHMIAVTRQR